MKWLGLCVVSIVMGMFFGGMGWIAYPALDNRTFTVLAIGGTAMILRVMAGLAMNASSIELQGDIRGNELRALLARHNPGAANLA